MHKNKNKLKGCSLQCNAYIFDQHKWHCNDTFNAYMFIYVHMFNF